MKVRLKFSKTGALKFVGHLDLMRTFQKIFRMSGIPIGYSEGFNPHQIFSIAAPLGVGTTSSAEYLDLKLIQHVEALDLMKQINLYCPVGIEVLEVKYLDENESAAMASVVAARYHINQHDLSITADLIETFKAQENIYINKISKKGVRNTVDIKPAIYMLECHNQIISMMIATGSKLNIKPQAVCEAICEFAKTPYDRFNYEIHRDALYKDIDNLVTL